MHKSPPTWRIVSALTAVVIGLLVLLDLRVWINGQPVNWGVFVLLLGILLSSVSSAFDPSHRWVKFALAVIALAFVFAGAFMHFAR